MWILRLRVKMHQISCVLLLLNVLYDVSEYLTWTSSAFVLATPDI